MMACKEYCNPQLCYHCSELRKQVVTKANNTMMRTFVFFIVSAVFVSCNPNVGSMNKILEKAGSNRTELEKVLSHYENDSMKYKAAQFLINNMAYYFYYEGEGLNDYLIPFEEYSKKNTKPQQIVDSLNRIGYSFSINGLKKCNDLECITSEYLINNIDWAFKVWKEQPWGKHVSFDVFCEFILPHRIGDEPLIGWRENLYTKFNPLIDSIRNLPEAENPVFVAQHLMDYWERKPFKWTSLFPAGPHLGPIVTELKTGSCREQTDAIIYILRSVGIPCGTDMVMQRGETNASHFWCFVLDKNGDTYISEPTIWSEANQIDIKRAKIMRKTYSLNKGMKESMDGFSEIHPNFRTPMFYDVTKIYAQELVDSLSIPIDSLYKPFRETQALYYLCLSNRDEWVPVDFTRMKDNKITFSHVESDVVCSIGIWDKEQLQIISDPFLIDPDTHTCKFYRPKESYSSKCLFNKYSIFVGDFVDRMIGGVVEGSNDSDFVCCDTLFMIEKAPLRLLNIVYPSNDKSYRYVRYRGKDGSYCNISELLLFENASDTIPLKGRVIGTPGSKHGDGKQEYTNVFDGDFYTSFNYKYESGGWAGLDLSYPHKISKIGYVPRNRDNFVRKGDVYELFFWKEGKWNSLGRKVSSSDSLVYDTPDNSLLYLKNMVRGKDERIFDVVNGIQQFR